MRLSLKIHHNRPSQLQPELHQRMDALLGAANCAVESGFIRPGCVHLTLQLRVRVRRTTLPQAQQQQQQQRRRQLLQPSQAALADSVTQALLAVQAQTWSWALLGGSERDESSNLRGSSTTAAAMKDSTSALDLIIQLPSQTIMSIGEGAVQLAGGAAAAGSDNVDGDSSSRLACKPCLHRLMPCCVMSKGCQVTLQATGTGLVSPGVTVPPG